LYIFKNYFNNFKIIKTIDYALINILNYDYKPNDVGIYDINIENYNDNDYLNELELVLPNKIDDEFYKDNTNIEYIIDKLNSEININIEQNNDEYINNIDCTLSKMVQKEYIINFCEIVDIYPKNIDNGCKKISISQKEKLAKENRLNQKIINKSDNDVKLINNNTNSEIIQNRVQQLGIKRQNKIIDENIGENISEDILNNEINHNLMINKYKQDISNKLEQCYILYEKYVENVLIY
jgi:hypothetical protein